MVTMVVASSYLDEHISYKKEKLSRRLILRFTSPVLDCFFKMFQPFFQILADDLSF